MAETNGASADRLDRVEHILKVIADSGPWDLRQAVKMLLEAQGDVSDRMREAFAKLDARMDEIAAGQKRVDENMRALRLTVDEFIHGRKPE